MIGTASWWVLAATVVFGAAALPVLFCAAFRLLSALCGARTRSVAVVVLGDIGRSPRMQYHCMSLAALPDTRVTVVGFGGEACVDAVESNPRISKRLLSPPPFRRCSRRWFLLYAPLKVVIQVAQLLWALLAIPRPVAYLVQNPPSIPTLVVVLYAAACRGSRVVIDWHNFGFTILALGLGPRHPFVLFAKWYERLFGRMADAHICVTAAMQGWLRANWGVQATVLYDKAPSFFRPTDVATRHELFTRLATDFPPMEGARAGDTLFTRIDAQGQPEAHPDRPALIVSSTSWTPDEDFSILLSALIDYDKRARASSRTRGRGLPNLWVVVTGKGPQRAMYERQIRELDLRHVSINTIWLEAADYPLLLGSADLGVCLHTSSSGLDLPMKVVDMFGCRLPVCAVHFKCIGELVRHGENGLTFKTPAELAQRLATLMGAHPCSEGDGSQLAELRRGVHRTESVTWQDNWNRNAAPFFAPLLAATTT